MRDVIRITRTVSSWLLASFTFLNGEARAYPDYISQMLESAHWPTRWWSPVKCDVQLSPEWRFRKFSGFRQRFTQTSEATGYLNPKVFFASFALTTMQCDFQSQAVSDPSLLGVSQTVHKNCTNLLLNDFIFTPTRREMEKCRNVRGQNLYVCCCKDNFFVFFLHLSYFLFPFVIFL